MQLRLKKIDFHHWRDTQLTLDITRTEFNDVFVHTGPAKPVKFYDWNANNTYQTEYKKMRAALVAYLAPKPEFTNEDYGRMADEERQKRMQAEAEIERLTADLARMVKQHEADKQTINEMALKYMEQENIKDQALLDAYALVHKKEAKRLSKRHRIDFKQAPSNKLPRTVTF